MNVRIQDRMMRNLRLVARRGLFRMPDVPGLGSKKLCRHLISRGFILVSNLFGKVVQNSIQVYVECIYWVNYKDFLLSTEFEAYRRVMSIFESHIFLTSPAFPDIKS